MPYFAYLSVLHLYETVGFWRKADWLKVHFAESWNELHHLLIMEELGGSKHWGDRFLAQHVALLYYWVVVALYMVAPRSAYHFMELVEEHAYHTYDTFTKEHEAALKAQPAPQVAINYYRDGDLYMFNGIGKTDPLSDVLRLRLRLQAFLMDFRTGDRWFSGFCTGFSPFLHPSTLFLSFREL